MEERFEDVFGYWLKVKRTEARMTRKQLSEKSGVSEDSIGQYERGKTEPLAQTACSLAEALGCTINDLCGWKS